MKPQSANVKMKVTSSGMVSTFLLVWHTLKLEVATMVLPGPCIDQTSWPQFKYKKPILTLLFLKIFIDISMK